MRKLKLLLLVFATILFTSCISTIPVTAQDNYNMNQYDYNYDQIDYYYNNHMDWFYTNFYYSNLGVKIYWYQHPYFIRYRTHYYQRHHRHLPRYTHMTYRSNYNRSSNVRNRKKPRSLELNRRSSAQRTQTRSGTREQLANRARNIRLKPNTYKPRTEVRRNTYPINRTRTNTSVQRTPQRSTVQRNTSNQRSRSAPTQSRRQKK